jgi:hypothetical protein
MATLFNTDDNTKTDKHLLKIKKIIFLYKQLLLSRLKDLEDVNPISISSQKELFEYIEIRETSFLCQRILDSRDLTEYYGHLLGYSNSNNNQYMKKALENVLREISLKV